MGDSMHAGSQRVAEVSLWHLLAQSPSMSKLQRDKHEHQNLCSWVDVVMVVTMDVVVVKTR